MKNLLTCASCLLVLLCAVRAHAIEVTLKDSHCITYREIPAFGKPLRGAANFVQQIYTPPQGKVLCQFSFLLSIKWDAKKDDYELPTKSVSVKADTGSAQPIGRREEISGFMLSTSEGALPLLYESRPYDWKEVKSTQHVIHLLYLVDAGAKELTAKINKDSVTLAIPAPQAFEPWKDLKVKFVSAKAIDAIMIDDGIGTVEEKRKMVNRGGSILAVTLELQRATPRKEFDASPDIYQFLDIDDFSLAFGRGGHATCLGKDVRGRLDSLGTIRFDKDELTTATQQLTLYFPIPLTLTEFDVAFDGQMVAKGKVSK